MMALAAMARRAHVSPLRVAHMGTATQGASSQAAVFIDAAWLESRLLQWYAPQTETNGEGVCIDGSALGRFLMERLNAAYPMEGNPVAKLHKLGYSSSQPDAAPQDASVTTALSEGGVQMRNFVVAADGPVLAPAVAMVADMFHTAFNPASALPGHKGGKAPVLVLVTGSASYAPAVARLAQAGVHLHLAATAQDVARMQAVLPGSVRGQVSPIHLDDVFPAMVLPPTHFSHDDTALAAAVARLHASVAAAPAPVPSADLHTHLTEAGVRPFMAARKLGARQVVGMFPSGFTVTKAGNGAYTLAAVGEAPPAPQHSNPTPPKVESQPDTPTVETDASVTEAAPEEAESAPPASPEEAESAPPASPEEAAASPPAPSLTIADVDLPLLMEQAHQAGLVPDAGVNRRTLYRLLSGSGVTGARSRMARAELNDLLVQHLDTVAAAITAPRDETAAEPRS